MGESLLATLRLVAAYSGYSGAEPVAGPSGVQVEGEGGQVITGLATVSRHIASQSSNASYLLGKTPEQQAQVNEWLSWASSELQPLVDDKLFKVNDFLLSRSYLVGTTPTLADLVVFGVTHAATSSFPVAQTQHFCNLLRWAEHIQASANTAAVFPKLIAFKKPQFVPPPPSAAVVSRAAPAATPSTASTSAPAAAPAAAPAPTAKAPKGGAAATAPAPAAPAPAAAAPPPAASGQPAAPTEAPASASTSAAPPAAPDSTLSASAPGKKEKAPAAAGGGGTKKGGGGDDDVVSIDMLDIAVGTIVKVDKHPNADALYLEEIDVGEDKPRQVISGLVKFVPQDKMLGRRVLVVLNLKPAKMRDVMSYGMVRSAVAAGLGTVQGMQQVLCSSNATHDVVDPVIIPDGVPNGERVTFEGFTGKAMDEVNPKKKVLERLFPDMKTDAEGFPVFKGAKFMTSKGPVTSTLPNGSVA